MRRRVWSIPAIATIAAVCAVGAADYPIRAVPLTSVRCLTVSTELRTRIHPSCSLAKSVTKSPSTPSPHCSLVESVFALSLPNGVTLAPYHRCNEQALRYVRSASDGTVLTDAMLRPATGPSIR